MVTTIVRYVWFTLGARRPARAILRGMGGGGGCLGPVGRGGLTGSHQPPPRDLWRRWHERHGQLVLRDREIGVLGAMARIGGQELSCPCGETRRIR